MQLVATHDHALRNNVLTLYDLSALWKHFLDSTTHLPPVIGFAKHSIFLVCLDQLDKTPYTFVMKEHNGKKDSLFVKISNAQEEPLKILNLE